MKTLMIAHVSVYYFFIFKLFFSLLRAPQGSEVQQNQGLAAGFLQTTQEPQHTVSICRLRLPAPLSAVETHDLGSGVRLFTERQRHPVGNENQAIES